MRETLGQVPGYEGEEECALVEGRGDRREKLHRSCVNIVRPPLRGASARHTNKSFLGTHIDGSILGAQSMSLQACLTHLSYKWLFPFYRWAKLSLRELRCPAQSLTASKMGNCEGNPDLHSSHTAWASCGLRAIPCAVHTVWAVPTKGQRSGCRKSWGEKRVTAGMCPWTLRPVRVLACIPLKGNFFL